MIKSKKNLLKYIAIIILGLALSTFVTIYIFDFKDVKINVAVFIGTFLFFFFSLKEGVKFEKELEETFAKNREKSGVKKWHNNINDTLKKL